jgi:dipeptidyl aminopeptidase/acylaminoacyl peptidase
MVDTRVVSLLIGGTPREDPRAWAVASPISYAWAGGPFVLLLHGGKDIEIPPEHSQELASALQSPGADCTLILAPEVGHVLCLSSHEEVWRFFDEKLKP